MHIANFLVPDTKPLDVLHVRWNALEKSYPPRSCASKEGLRFGKSAPFPYHPFERISTREDFVSLFVVIFDATRKTDADVGERAEAEEKEERIRRSDNGRGETNVRACYTYGVHEPSYTRALEWKGERMIVRAREQTEGHGKKSATTREGESQRQRDSERAREEGRALPPPSGGENYPESAWGVRPRLRSEPRTSEASAVPDIHQVPHGTRLEARTVRHTVHSTIRPMLDRRRSGPRRHQASSTRAVTRPHQTTTSARRGRTSRTRCRRASTSRHRDRSAWDRGCVTPTAGN